MLQLGDHGLAGSEKYALEEMQRAEKRVRHPACNNIAVNRSGMQ